MNIKKILIALFTLATIFMLAACGGAAPASDQASGGEMQPAEEIVMFNWTDYINPEVYDLFEAEFGIKVVESNFYSNEELLAKLQGGASGYAIIVPSDFTISIMRQEEMLADLDHANIPNLGNLGETFKSPPFDPELQNCVPYQWGTTGIGYLAGAVPEPESWAVFFEPDPDSPVYGRMAMLDDTREIFAAALLYLGYDPNTTDPAQLEQAKQLLIQAKAGLAGFDSDTYDNNLAAGELLLAHGWNGDFLLVQEENEDISYIIPKEGGVIYLEGLCIPKSATPEEKLAAEIFINFILRPDIGALNTEYIYYGTPNAAAEELLSEEFRSNEMVFPSEEVLQRLHYLEPAGEAEALYQRLWDEVKAAN